MKVLDENNNVKSTTSANLSMLQISNIFENLEGLTNELKNFDKAFKFLSNNY